MSENTTFIIKKGDSTLSIASSLKEQKIIPHAVSFLCGAAFFKIRKESLKHGEYLIDPKITLWKLMQKIAKDSFSIHVKFHHKTPGIIAILNRSQRYGDVFAFAEKIDFVSI